MYNWKLGTRTFYTKRREEKEIKKKDERMEDKTER
jgi:hypothetical protein